MGIKLGDAYVLFKGESGPLEKSTDDAVRSTKSKFGGLASSLNTLIGGAIVGGVGAAVAGVTAIGTAAIGVANDFQAAKNTISTQLAGLGVDTAAYGETAKRIFANNFGGSIDEAAKALAEVRKQLGDLPQDELQNATENAFRLSDAFGEDMTKNVNTAKVLMEQFGLSQQQAFDFITTGFQKGLNSSGDFLDSIGEYSNLFAQNGFSADQFFSLMETGMQGGVLGTDKMADAFKEAGINIQELGDDMLESLEIAGVDVDRLFNGLQDGSVTVADAISEILPVIESMENPIYRNSMGTKIFGTMWEDLGTNAFMALDLAKTGLDEMAGATAGLDEQYNTLGARFETLQRQAMVALEPLGAQILSIVETAMPTLQAFVEWISTIALPWVMELFNQMGVLFNESGIIEAFTGYQEIFAAVFGGISEALGLTSGEFSAMEAILWAVDKVFRAIAVQIQLSGVILYGMGAAIKFVIDKVKEVIFFIQQFQERLAGLQIPEFLQMHSPPPLAQALGMVKEQVEGLKNTDMPGLVDPTKQQGGDQPAAAGGGGGSQIIQLVVDGQVLAQVVNQHLGGLAAAGV